jgi:hypothetical protein
MRTLLLLCAVASFAGLAAAQTATTPATGTSTNTAAAVSSTAAPFYPNLEPTHDAAGGFPPNAIEEGKSGVAFLCCSAKPDRSLDCHIGSETPQHFGFGDAAMRFAHGAHLTTEAYTFLEGRPVQQFALSMHYRFMPVSDTEQQTADAALTAATDLCGAGTGPAPNYITISAERSTQSPGAGGGSGRHHSRTLGH